MYVALNGVVEGLAYLSTIPLLLFVGRKIAVSSLFFTSGILQLALLTITHGTYYNIEYICTLLFKYLYFYFF